MSLLYGVMRGTTTTCWGVGIGLFLCLPGAADGQTDRAQAVPPPKAPPPAVWRIELEAAQRADIAADAAAVYVAGGTAGLAAYAAGDGRQLWTRTDHADATVRQVGRFGSVLAILGAGGIEALDPATGTTRWTATLAGGDAVLAGDDAAIVAGAADLRLVDQAAGAEMWRVPLASAAVAVALDAARVVAVLADGSLMAVDRASGRHHWTVPLDGVVGGVTLSGERLYFLDRRGVLYAHRASDGARDWYFERFIEGGGRPAADDRQVYAAFFDNTLQAFDRTSGARRWHAPLSGRPSGAPWIHGGLLFVAHADGIVSVLSSAGARVAELGSRRDPGGSWEVRLESAGPVGDSGTVFTVTTDESGRRALSVWQRTK
jgi:outer membrane protein assembly factor BamB